MLFRSFPGLLAMLVVLAGSVQAARPKLPDRYDKWLKQEVVYIITDEERKAFLQMQSDEQRDQFIKDFWDLRNPIPGSAENSYKTLIYDRITYANSHFGRMTNTPGWMTDMGRTYILFGKPDSQASFTGYSQIYPIELWFYSNNTGNPSLPPFFYLMFFQPEGIEEYRYYRPNMDGPLKLVRGSSLNSNRDVYRFLQPLGGDLARATLSLIPSEPIDTTNYQPDLNSEMLISKIQNFANDKFNLQKVREQRTLRAQVSSMLLVAGKSLSLSKAVLTDPLGEKWLDYSVAIDDEQMGTRTGDGQFAVDLSYRLTTASGALVAEDDERSKYQAYESSSAFRPFQVAGRLPLVSGAYRLQVRVVNHATGHTFQAETPVSVQPNGASAWVSEPLLADNITQPQQPDAITPFQYYGEQFHPLLRDRIAAKNALRVLFQLHAPQSTDYDVTFVLANLQVREARRVITEHVPASEFRNQLLMKAKTIPLNELPGGEYMLSLQLKSGTGPVLASANQQVRIVDASSDPTLMFLTSTRNMAAPGLADYIRGLASLAQQDSKAATVYMTRACERNPANKFAKQYLIELYYHQRNYQAVTSVFKKSALSDFQVSPEALAQISVSLWQTGDRKEANAVIKQARGLFPQDSLLAQTEKILSNKAASR